MLREGAIIHEHNEKLDRVISPSPFKLKIREAILTDVPMLNAEFTTPHHQSMPAEFQFDWKGTLTLFMIEERDRHSWGKGTVCGSALPLYLLRVY